MADRLVVTEEKYIFRIQWEIDDGDDLGGYPGDSLEDLTDEPPKDRGDWENWVAGRTLRSAPGVQIDSIGPYWETRKQAQAALRLVKEALKQDRPLPEWAKKALAEGWTAPKGWKA